MDLSQLVFRVDTKELDEAATKVKALGTAVSNVNKPLDQMSKVSEKAAVSAAKVTKANADAAAASSRAEAAAARANRTTSEGTAATARNVTVLEKQQAILEFMSKGFSKGQATVMAQARATGILTDEMKELGDVLLTQRKLQGGDPFDKSTSGLIALKNQYGEIKEAVRQYNSDSGLTSKQTRELARDKERIIEAMKAEGKGFQEIRAAVSLHNDAFVEAATKVNTLVNSEKELERQARDSTNAVRALGKEEDRVSSMINTMSLNTNVNAKTSERAAQSIAQYTRNLRLAGITGAEAAVRLEKYRQSIIRIQGAEERRKVQQLSRALTPQISDIAVSLQGGMSPLTVMMQQGLQVRDLIAQSGVGALELKKAFATAAAEMVGSIKSTASALGSLLIGAIVDSGKAVVNFGSDISGLTVLLDKMRGAMVANLGMGARPLLRVFETFAKGAAISMGVAIAGLVISLGALAVGFVKVIKEENALSAAMAQTGGAFGLNRDRAYEVANSMNAMGVSTTKGIAALIEITKHSNLASQDIKVLTKSAVDMEKYAGVAVADTAKAFSAMAGKPLESLVELGQATGRVSPEVIKLVAELERQGRTAEAAAIGMNELVKSNKMTVEQIEADYGLLMRSLGGVKSFFSGIWDSILGVGRQGTLTDKLKEAQENLLSAEAKAKQNPNDRRIANYVNGKSAEVEALKEQIRLRQMALDKQSDQARLAGVAGEWEKRVTSNLSGKQKLENEILEIRRQGIALGKTEKEIEDQIAAAKAKAPKAPKTDAEKEAANLQKYFNKELENASDIYIKLTGIQEHYTQGQRKMLDLFNDPNFWKLTQQERDRLINLQLINHEQEIATVELQKQRALVQELNQAYVKLQADRDKAVFDLMDESDKLNQSLDDETESLILQAKLIGASDEARKRAVETRRVELELAAELRKIDGTDFKNNESVRAEMIAAAHARASQKIKNINKQIAIDAANEYTEKITDAITTALFEGGRAGSKKLRDLIVAELQKPIRLYIQAIVGSITGGGSGSGGGLINNVVDGSAGGSTLNILSMVKNAYNSFTGAIAGFGDTVAFAANDLGAYLVNNTSGILNQAGSYLMESSSSIGASASTFATAAAGIVAGNLISDGYSAIGKNQNTAVIIGAAIGSIFPVIGTALGAMIGGLVNRVFGRRPAEIVAQGVQGNISTNGSDLKSYYQTYAKGGWFRSSKTSNYEGEVGSKFQDSMSLALRSVTFSVAQFATSLGLQADVINGFSKFIRLNLLGLDAEAQTAAIQNELTLFGNDLANFFLPALVAVQRDGENAYATLARLSSSLSNVNSIFDTLSVTLMASTVAGGEASSKLLDLFGGLESFTDKTTAYYQAFYTEQERVSTTTRQLTSVFAQMGLVLPTTNAEFRALVESQNLYTDAGRATYTALLNLAPAFDSITKATEQFVSSLIDEVRRLRGEILQGSGASGLAYMQSDFAIKTAQARAGDAGALEALPELSKAIETAAKSQAASAADVIRIQAWLANSLQETATALGIPAFASGGIHNGGARIVGENGPELEITGPSKIYNSQQTNSMLNSGGGVSDLLVQLNENITGLRYEVRADVSHNAKTAKLLDRAMPDGDSIAITGIDGGEI